MCAPPTCVETMRAAFLVTRTDDDLLFFFDRRSSTAFHGDGAVNAQPGESRWFLFFPAYGAPCLCAALLFAVSRCSFRCALNFLFPRSVFLLHLSRASFSFFFFLVAPDLHIAVKPALRCRSCYRAYTWTLRCADHWSCLFYLTTSPSPTGQQRLFRSLLFTVPLPRYTHWCYKNKKNPVPPREFCQRTAFHCSARYIYIYTHTRSFLFLPITFAPLLLAQFS
jgi:hypothetical protein